ncbi:MAG TPA: sugar ABC transporter permease [Trueperaceae bacterium]
MSVTATAKTRPRAHRAGTPQRRRRTLTAYLFLGPVLAFLAVFFFFPLLQVVYYSLTDFDLYTAHWVGGSNYRNLLADPLFWTSLKKSFLYLLCTPILIVLSLALAIVVNRPLQGIAFFRAMYFLPAVISAVAIGIIFELVFADSGLLNGLLRQLGLTSRAVPFLQDPRLVLPSIMSVTIWRGVGYYMIMFLAGLQAIPKERYEAAAIDGAGWLQQHWHITVPGVRPIIVLVAVLSSIAALQAFDEIFILTGGTGGILNSGLTTMFYLYRQAFVYNNVGYASAMAVVFSLIIIGFTLLNLRLGRDQDG